MRAGWIRVGLVAALLLGASLVTQPAGAMFPASSKGGEMALAFPDVCKTPVPIVGKVAIPYPNVGQAKPAKKTDEASGDEQKKKAACSTCSAG